MLGRAKCSSKAPVWDCLVIRSGLRLCSLLNSVANTEICLATLVSIVSAVIETCDSRCDFLFLLITLCACPQLICTHGCLSARSKDSWVLAALSRSLSRLSTAGQRTCNLTHIEICVSLLLGKHYHAQNVFILSSVLEPVHMWISIQPTQRKVRRPAGLWPGLEAMVMMQKSQAVCLSHVISHFSPCFS